MQLLHQKYQIQGQEKAAKCLVYAFFDTTFTSFQKWTGNTKATRKLHKDCSIHGTKLLTP